MKAKDAGEATEGAANFEVEVYGYKYNLILDYWTKWIFYIDRKKGFLIDYIDTSKNFLSTETAEAKLKLELRKAKRKLIKQLEMIQ